MKQAALRLTLVLVAAAASLPAQTTHSSNDMSQPAAMAAGVGYRNSASLTAKHEIAAPAPFTRFALGGGISAMGVNLQAAVNANRYMNLRGTGNVFNYTVNNISTNGLNVNGKLNLATAGASVDFYPWPNHGFRLSPGLLFYNQNMATASMVATGGTSFTLNDVTYYSSPSNPVTGNGSLTLNKQNPAFTVTTGWGNMISRRGGHWSFPVEIGAALIGTPAVNIAFTSGQVCANPQGTVGCTNVVGNSTFNSNLQAQIAKYNNDLNPLRFYPIISFGVAYNFKLHGGAAIAR